MTVKELIEILQRLPNQDIRVVVSGYEGGCNDLTVDNITLIKIRLNANTAWYYGKHEPVSDEGDSYDEAAYILG